MNAPWDHANPGQGPPVLDTVTQPKHNEHPNADENGLEDCQASTNA